MGSSPTTGISSFSLAVAQREALASKAKALVESSPLCRSIMYTLYMFLCTWFYKWRYRLEVIASLAKVNWNIQTWVESIASNNRNNMVDGGRVVEGASLES